MRCWFWIGSRGTFSGKEIFSRQKYNSLTSGINPANAKNMKKCTVSKIGYVTQVCGRPRVWACAGFVNYGSLCMVSAPACACARAVLGQCTGRRQYTGGGEADGGGGNGEGGDGGLGEGGGGDKDLQGAYHAGLTAVGCETRLLALGDPIES